MSSLAYGILKISKRVHVSIFSFFALIFFFISQGAVYSLLFLSAAMLHELSHIVFLYRYGAEILKVTVFPFGVDILCDTRHLSYKKELVSTLSGSFANLLIALISYLFLSFFASPPLLFFVLCNLFLGVFNLIPVSFFDGGKAVRLILYDRLDIDKAFYIHKSLDILSALIFLYFSIFMLSAANFNLSVICVVIYAAVSTLAEYIKIPCRKL